MCLSSPEQWSSRGGAGARRGSEENRQGERRVPPRRSWLLLGPAWSRGRLAGRSFQRSKPVGGLLDTQELARDEFPHVGREVSLQGLLGQRLGRILATGAFGEEGLVVSACRGGFDRGPALVQGPADG